jgi:hypothetical protein
MQYHPVLPTIRVSHEIELVENGIVVVWVSQNQLIFELGLQTISIFYRWAAIDVIDIPSFGPCKDKKSNVGSIIVSEILIDLCPSSALLLLLNLVIVQLPLNPRGL